jgi:YVTN family beta-propeller protein
VIGLASEKVEATLQAEVKGANRLQFTPDGRRVLVTTHAGKDLVVLDAKTRELVKRVPIEERGASGIQVQPDGRRVFVACPRDHFVAVVDLEKLERVATIDVGREPDGMAWW